MFEITKLQKTIENNELYNWERYWILYGYDIDATYFHYGRKHIDRAKTLKELRDHQYLILLGDAALGKTTTLNQEELDLKVSGEVVLKIDFKDIQGEVYLKSKFDALKQSIKGKKGNIYLLFDSFDEGHNSFEKLVKILITELESLPMERIYLRIACRTVVYPEILEAELNELIKKSKLINSLKTTDSGLSEMKSEVSAISNKISVFRLLPLNTENIDIALEKNNIEKQEFWDKIKEMSLESSLFYPIIVKRTVEKYPESLNKTQYELYEDLILSLSEKLNQINNGVLAPSERMYISSIIATLMTFTNKQYISYIKEGINREKEQTLFLQDYISTIEDLSNNKKLALLSGNIEEVLNTGLFTGASDNIDFQQKTYKEFLVAYFLDKNKLYENFSNLIFDENNKVIPQFYNLAGWLAEKDEIIFKNLLENDPEALIVSNVRFSSEEKNQHLIETFFDLIDKNSMTANYDVLSDSIIKLKSQDLVQLVDPLLSHQNKDVVYYALRFVRTGSLKSLENKVYAIALDSNAERNCRYLALIILGEFNNPSLLEKIQDNLSCFEIEDFEYKNRLKSILINILMPSFLSMDNLISILENVNSDKFFINLDKNKLLLNTQDFYRIFDWLIDCNLDKGKKNIFGIQDLNKALSEHLIKMENKTDEKKYICNLIKTGIKDYKYHNISDVIRSYLREKENSNIKYNIFDAIFDQFLKEEDYEDVYAYGNYFFSKQDIWFLLKQFNKLKDMKKKKFIFTIIISFYGIPRFYYSMPAILTEVKQIIKNRKITHQEWRIKGFLRSIYSQFKKPRNIYYKIKSFISRRRPVDYLKNALNKYRIDKNVQWWGNAIHNMNLCKPFTDHDAILPTNITVLAGWNKLNNNEKDLIYKLAFDFLQNRIVKQENKINILTTNKLPLLDFLSCFQALTLLQNYKPEFFNQLIKQEEIVKKWLIFLIKYPEFTNNDTEIISKAKKILFKEFFDENSTAFIQEIEFIVDTLVINGPTTEEIYYDFLNNLGEINNNDFYEMLLLKLKQQETNKEFFFDKLFRYIVEFLLKNEYVGVKIYLKFLLQKDFSEIPINLQAISAYFLMLKEKNSWALFKDKIENNEEFGKTFFESHGHNSFHFSENRTQDITKMLSDKELSEFYILLDKYFPRSEDTDLNGFVSKRDEITELRRNLLNIFMGTGRFRVYEYIKQNSDIIIDSYYYQKSKRNYSEISYNFISIENLFEIISNELRKIILNNRQLLDIVLIKLEEIQKELRQDQGYLKLWNEIQQGNTGKIYYPKDEVALSDEIKRELQRKLNNVVINREIEIKRSLSRGDGQRVDLKIDCPINGSIATVIIEVKGCWNSALEDSIEGQLLKQYLHDDNGYKYGIYVIGWYCCSLWDEANRKKRTTDTLFNMSIIDIERNFEAKSGDLSTKDKTVKSFILDVTIPESNLLL